MEFFSTKKRILMNKTSELAGILSKYFKWNKARLNCFTQMLIALFIVRTVNLSEIAVAMESKATISSRYKRIKRFFQQFNFDYVVIARWIFWLLDLKGRPVYLAIDRTNWCWGKQPINVFVLSVLYAGVAIPLFWRTLPKKGSSSFDEQQELIKRFIDTFKKKQIAGLVADREFGNGDLFKWLKKEKIPFYIRIKNGALVTEKGKKNWPIEKSCSFLNCKQQTSFSNAVTIYNTTLWVAAGRSEKGELMIVVTNQCPKNAINTYLKRWGIETFFACLKTRGFRFEDTHMTQHERIAKLMALLAIGFCWALKLGEWAVTKKTILIKNHKEGKRPQNSLFRYGLDFIRDTIINPLKRIEFKELLHIFKSPSIKKRAFL